MTPRDDERPKTILINPRQGQKHIEGRAKDGQSIMPGMAVEVVASGTVGGVSSTSTDLPRTNPILQKVSTAGADQRFLLVKERFIAGEGLGDAVPNGDVVLCAEIQKGDRFLGRVASNFVSTPGTKMKFSNDGTFVAQGGSGKVVAEVEDNVNWNTLDISDFDSDDPRAQPLVAMVAV